MPSPFVTVTELTAALSSSRPPAVLDASLVLHPARFDGDYRRESGRPLWLEGHIPTSQHVDVSTQFSDPTAAFHYTHPEPQAIADELARIGVGEHTEVVIYDATGGLWAARLWYLLTWIGVDARVLDGGLDAWKGSGRPVEAGEQPLPASVSAWRASAVREAWITKEKLTGRAESDGRPLVCGLPSGIFTGAEPTRYSRRGHIPGSVNVSSRDLYAADGTVRGENELREAYIAQGVTGEEEVLLYCGGGISASGNAITLAELGVTAVRIYDGSLEEWSADESLPLVVG
ncbi:MAG TPA: rhodanese-like domain-containing protein [Lacisediminihabitans sp.]|uniref:sulfurtransferase n=1 Tax=Lacisediminihabitans sp. TaxID=2787631 RepID=UPI002EDA8A32